MTRDPYCTPGTAVYEPARKEAITTVERFERLEPSKAVERFEL